MNLQTTKSLLRAHGLRPNKRLGQHFLVDPIAAERIVAAAEIQPDETILEIGPGLGALTGLLLERARRVIAVEVDEHLCAILTEELGGRDNLEIIPGDFLDQDLPALAHQAGAGRLKVIGNLPYQITGQALRMILDHLRLLGGAVLTVQREVANRIMAQPGSKTFGILSVAAQYFSRPEKILRLPREAFYPQPQIVSTVMALKPQSAPPIALDDEALFFSLVKGLFGHRRKTARNALRAHPLLRLAGDQIEALSRQTDIDLGRRAETMSLPELGRLCNALGKLRHAHDQA